MYTVAFLTAKDALFVSSSNWYVEILAPSTMLLGGGTFEMWLGHEGRTLMNISALIQKTPESSLISSIIWGHGKNIAVYEQGNWPRPDTKSASALILGFPAQRNVKDTFPLFVRYQL